MSRSPTKQTVDPFRQRSRNGSNQYPLNDEDRSYNDLSANRQPPQASTPTAASAAGAASGYKVIFPDEQKRQKVLQKAEQEERRYNEHKASKPKPHYSYQSPLGGGALDEDMVRQQQLKENKTAAIRKREQREEYVRKKKEEDQKEHDQKKARQREKALQNERRDRERTERLKREERQARGKYLDSLSLTDSYSPEQQRTSVGTNPAGERGLSLGSNPLGQSKPSSGTYPSGPERISVGGASPSVFSSLRREFDARATVADATPNRPSVLKPSDLSTPTRRSNPVADTSRHLVTQSSRGLSDFDRPAVKDTKKVNEERYHQWGSDLEKPDLELMEKSARGVTLKSTSTDTMTEKLYRSAAEDESPDDERERKLRLDHQRTNLAFLDKLQKGMQPSQGQVSEENEEEEMEHAEPAGTQGAAAMPLSSPDPPTCGFSLPVSGQPTIATSGAGHDVNSWLFEDQLRDTPPEGEKNHDQIHFNANPDSRIWSQPGATASEFEALDWQPWLPSDGLKGPIPTSPSSASDVSEDSDTAYAAFKKRQMDALYNRVSSGIEPSVREPDDFYVTSSSLAFKGSPRFSAGVQVPVKMSQAGLVDKRLPKKEPLQRLSPEPHENSNNSEDEIEYPPLLAPLRTFDYLNSSRAAPPPRLLDPLANIFANNPTGQRTILEVREPTEFGSGDSDFTFAKDSQSPSKVGKSQKLSDATEGEQPQFRSDRFIGFNSYEDNSDTDNSFRHVPIGEDELPLPSLNKTTAGYRSPSSYAPSRSKWDIPESPVDNSMWRNRKSQIRRPPINDTPGRGGRGEVDEEEDDETGLLYLLKTFPQYDCDALMNLLEELGDVEAVIRLLTLP